MNCMYISWDVLCIFFIMTRGQYFAFSVDDNVVDSIISYTMMEKWYGFQFNLHIMWHVPLFNFLEILTISNQLEWSKHLHNMQKSGAGLDSTIMMMSHATLGFTVWHDGVGCAVVGIADDLCGKCDKFRNTNHLVQIQILHCLIYIRGTQSTWYFGSAWFVRGDKFWSTLWKVTDKFGNILSEVTSLGVLCKRWHIWSTEFVKQSLVSHGGGGIECIQCTQWRGAPQL